MIVPVVAIPTDDVVTTPSRASRAAGPGRPSDCTDASVTTVTPAVAIAVVRVSGNPCGSTTLATDRAVSAAATALSRSAREVRSTLAR